MHTEQCIVLVKTRRVMQFSEMNVLFCFEVYVNTKCGKGQGIVTSEAIIVFVPCT